MLSMLSVSIFSVSSSEIYMLVLIAKVQSVRCLGACCYIGSKNVDNRLGTDRVFLTLVKSSGFGTGIRDILRFGQGKRAPMYSIRGLDLAKLRESELYLVTQLHCQHYIHRDQTSYNSDGLRL